MNFTVRRLPSIHFVSVLRAQGGGKRLVVRGEDPDYLGRHQGELLSSESGTPRQEVTATPTG
jgi:hypothetical protein